MTLFEFKKHIESSEDGTIFNYGISDPFSWRGAYDEVAFEILEEGMSKEDILERIQKAYEGVFIGYKGGEYQYHDYTTVNFEQSIRSYTDGGYCTEMIAKIRQCEIFESQEMRLVKLAFS